MNTCSGVEVQIEVLTSAPDVGEWPVLLQYPFDRRMRGLPGTDTAEKARFSYLYQESNPIPRMSSPYPVTITTEITRVLIFVKDRA
jgi:hypothetical protein